MYLTLYGRIDPLRKLILTQGVYLYLVVYYLNSRESKVRALPSLLNLFRIATNYPERKPHD
nr:MAG TPA: hypothetical protein [Caudoviricetes sp.]